MSLKSLLLWVVVALGLIIGAMVWMSDDGDVALAGVDVADSTAEAGHALRDVIPLSRSAEAAPRDETATAHDVVPAIGERLAQAERLVHEGKGAQVAGLLRQLRQSGSPAARGRAAYLLSLVTDEWVERRTLLSEALATRQVRGEEYEGVRVALDELNIRPGTSLLPLIETDDYEVQPGDSLWVLCNKTFPERFGVRHEVGLIQLVNGLSSSNLRVGDTLVVPRDSLHIRVSASQHGLACMLGEVALSAFHVGLGRESRTPVGDFTVQVKQENPDWYHNGQVLPFGDPENVLGTRWMGFQNQPGASGFGIHGTAHPDSIGLNESMGCIRMRNEEVEVLFDYVPRGTIVSIVD